jgi:hypothetical protein
MASEAKLKRRLADLQAKKSIVDESLNSVLLKNQEDERNAEKHRRENKIEFFTLDADTGGIPANPLQDELVNAWQDWFYKVFTYTGANRIGKTTIGAIIGISVLLGYLPWNRKRLHFTHNRTRKVRLIGQDWEKHIKAVVIPAWKEWWPKSRKLDKKKNNQGVDAIWTDIQTGSTMEIMSNNQDSDLHEGWFGDLIIYDEPPKRNIRVANARGLIDRQGRELFCMTLLKEAWVNRDVINARNEDGTPDRTVYNIDGDIYSNVGFGITEEGVQQFNKTLTDDERQARIYGKPSYLSGLVLKKYNRRKHLVKRFQIPLDWLVDIAIDTHPRKPQAILFQATSPRGDQFVCDEILNHGDGKWIAEQIITRIKFRTYMRINRVICDPLAKADSNNPNSTFDTIQRYLAPHDIMLEVATKDKDSGIIKINSALETPNGEASLFFFDDLVQTPREAENWMYEDKGENLGKPSKKEDDMMENLYRLQLLDTEWYDYEEDEDNYHEEQRVNSTTGY